MTSISKLKISKRKQRCFLCKTEIEENEMYGVSNNFSNLCIACSLSKIVLRKKILLDWLESKERLQKDILKFLKEHRYFENKFVLKELEKEY